MLYLYFNIYYIYYILCNVLHIIQYIILCMRHAAASKKLEHLRCFGAVFLHISSFIAEHSQSSSPTFIKTRYKAHP